VVTTVVIGAGFFNKPKEEKMKYKAVLPAILLAILPFARTEAEENACWDWGLTPYLWGASVHTDVRAHNDLANISRETRFKDIVSKLQMAFMGHAEGQGDNVGLFADIMYVSVGDQHDEQLFSTDSNLKTTIAEFAGVWSPGEKRGEGIEPFAGIRYFSTKFDMTLDPVDPNFNTARTELNKSYTDVMAGVRYRGSFSDKWGYSVRGDGSWGGTDGAYSASAIISYRLKKGEWDFGYRYMKINLTAASSDLNLKLYGPILAYTFKF
jgi:hypothetical protein